MSEGTDSVRETRWPGAYTQPGKIEHGCLTQEFLDGPMDRVYISATENEARAEVALFHRRGAKAIYVTRVIPEWTESV